MLLDCTTELAVRTINEKFRDYNFSLRPVTVADETTVSGREFQTLIRSTRFEKDLPGPRQCGSYRV